MRIGIDARLYAQTGVGRYIKNLISTLEKIDDRNEYFIYLRKKEFDGFAIPNTRWHKSLLDVGWHTLSEQFVVPIRFLRDRIDVAHFPYFNVPVLYPGKFLLTIHDLIVDHFDTGRATTLPLPLYKLKRLGYKVGTTLAISRAAHIVAISNTTKIEVVSHYHVKESSLSVTFDALDNDFMRVKKSSKGKKYFSDPYILYVGNAYPHKNLIRLIHAVKLLNQKQNIRLVLAGNDHFFYPRLQKYVDETGLNDRIIFFGDAKNGQLVNLYTHAKLIVIPSLMEGFGLVNLEAVYCGRLPVVSDIAVFRELWHNDLLFFDPYNETDLAHTLDYALSLSPARYKKLVSNASRRLKNFSWEKTAKETLVLYEKIYQSQHK